MGNWRNQWTESCAFHSTIKSDKALVRGWKESTMIGQAISGHARVNWIATHIAPMTSQAEIFLGSKDANSGKKK